MKIKPFSELKWKIHLLNYGARNDPFIIQVLGGVSIAILLKMASTVVVEKQVSWKQVHMGSSELSCNMLHTVFHHQFQNCVTNPSLVDTNFFWQCSVTLNVKDGLMSSWWYDMYDVLVGRGLHEKGKPPSQNWSLILRSMRKTSFIISFFLASEGLEGRCFIQTKGRGFGESDSTLNWMSV